jgi:hypothetical protein
MLVGGYGGSSLLQQRAWRKPAGNQHLAPAPSEAPEIHFGAQFPRQQTAQQKLISTAAKAVTLVIQGLSQENQGYGSLLADNEAETFNQLSRQTRQQILTLTADWQTQQDAMQALLDSGAYSAQQQVYQQEKKKLDRALVEKIIPLLAEEVRHSSAVRSNDAQEERESQQNSRNQNTSGLGFIPDTVYEYQPKRLGRSKQPPAAQPQRTEQPRQSVEDLMDALPEELFTSIPDALTTDTPRTSKRRRIEDLPPELFSPPPSMTPSRAQADGVPRFVPPPPNHPPVTPSPTPVEPAPGFVTPPPRPAAFQTPHPSNSFPFVPPPPGVNPSNSSTPLKPKMPPPSSQARPRHTERRHTPEPAFPNPFLGGNRIQTSASGAAALNPGESDTSQRDLVIGTILSSVALFGMFVPLPKKPTLPSATLGALPETRAPEADSPAAKTQQPTQAAPQVPTQPVSPKSENPTLQLEAPAAQAPVAKQKAVAPPAKPQEPELETKVIKGITLAKIPGTEFWLNEKAARAFIKAQKEAGFTIELNDAYRPREEQERLYRKLKGTQAVAPPGTSNHEIEQGAMAIDVQNYEEARPFLEKHGFEWSNHWNDPWHFDFVG